MRRAQGEGVQRGAHGVVDARGGLVRPGGEGEEEGIGGEEVEEVGELGAQVVRAVGAAREVSMGGDDRGDGGAYPCVAWW